MDDQSRRLESPLPLLVIAVVALASVAALGALTYLEFDPPTSLTLSPRHVTVGTIVAGTLLVVGAIALPAYVLSGWQSAQEEAGRERRP
ncbi:hypothetical protein [Natronorubrum sp. DTA28]|uniref:hypothetical protein n=1 Tax=Natronorubrum sp. DTA28 TaxID=3447019 RepID=UPI003F85CE51